MFAQTIALALGVADTYRNAKLEGNAGETEAQVKSRLQDLIDWSAKRQGFVDKDTSVNSTGFHAWETAQGGGPTAGIGAGNIGGVAYGQIFKSRTETDPNYTLPAYSDYDPWAP